MTRSRWRLFGLWLSVIWTGLAGAQPPYTFRDLGDFVPFALNGQQTLGGSVIDASGQRAARLKSGATAPEDFGVDGRVNSVHPSGIVVGYSGCFAPGCINQEATAWDNNGTGYLLGLLPGGFASSATSVNKWLGICGYGIDATGRIRGILLVPLEDYGFNAYCDSLNAWGWMVGSGQYVDGYLHALLWVSPNDAYDLHAEIDPSAPQSWACCITDTGWMAGTVWTATGGHVWRWSLGGNPVVLPDPPGLSNCQAHGLDMNGDVVGLCTITGKEAETGALWQANGTTVDLSRYALAGKTVDAATAISHGVITCLREPPHPVSGCLLTPTMTTSRR
jgi:hypothetical protein